MTMRQYLLIAVRILILLAVLGSFSRAQLDSLKNLGHASMKITTAEGKIVYIDPYAGTAADYADSADILLVTHAHNDHNNQSLVKLKSGGTQFTYVEANKNGVLQSITVGSIKIDAVAAYNINHSKTVCVGFVLEFNGIKLYHAGDTGVITEMSALASRNLDYALLPMEGVYTMSPEQATAAADSIKAKMYVPIHTMTGQNDTVNDAFIARFTVPNKITLKRGKSIALVSNPVSTGARSAAPPHRFALEQNFPNPFNPSTAIRFSLPDHAFTTLNIVDVLGKNISTLASGDHYPGSHTYQWNAGESAGGVYFYRLTSGTQTETKKLLLIK